MPDIVLDTVKSYGPMAVLAAWFCQRMWFRYVRKADRREEREEKRIENLEKKIAELEAIVVQCVEDRGKLRGSLDAAERRIAELERINQRLPGGTP